MKGHSNPWKYPFCDLFVYRHNEPQKKFLFRREQARLWWPHNVYEDALASVNGTYLRKFGDIEMRVVSDSEKHLKRFFGNEWRYIGTRHNMNHYTLTEQKKVEFLIPDNFRIP